MSYCTPYQKYTYCDLFKNPCNVSEKRLEEATDRRVNNQFYFNGITKHGYQWPIMEAVNPQCTDPIVGKPQLEDFLAGPDDLDPAKVAERFHYLDVYSGLVNGINYGKLNRLDTHKRKHARSPFAPFEKFCVPIASNMNYGWWMRDLDCLERTNWYKPSKRFPQRRSEMTIFADEMGKTTPNFILF